MRSGRKRLLRTTNSVNDMYHAVGHGIVALDDARQGVDLVNHLKSSVSLMAESVE